MGVDRRDFLLALGTSLAASGIPAAAVAPAPVPSRPDKPLNVVLMICDDLGYGDLGCLWLEYPDAAPGPVGRTGDALHAL